MPGFGFHCSHTFASEFLDGGVMHQSVNCGHGCHWVLEDFIPFGEHQFTDDHHAAPILLAYPNAWIYQFSEEGMVRVKYEDTEHFQITRDYLNRHEPMVEMLLGAEAEDLKAKERK